MANKKGQEKLVVWMSKQLKKKLDKIIEVEGYELYAEYVRSCIRRDFERIMAKNYIVLPSRSSHPSSDKEVREER